MELNIWDRTIPYHQQGADTPNRMTTFLLDTNKPLPCVVVLPGGGYHARAPHEGDPIAAYFNSCGLHAAVVHYRVAPNRFPAGLCDVQRAIRILRAHAAEWKIDPCRIVVCGFSAGGHLAASGILWDDVLPEGTARDGIDMLNCRPDGAILSYPVISVASPFGHLGSGRNLLGEERYGKDAEAFCLERLVTDQTPPVFLWHTSDDPVVNVKNSLVFCERLRDHGVPFELHIYPHGPHGMGLASDREDACAWASLAADWIRRAVPGSGAAPERP